MANDRQSDFSSLPIFDLQAFLTGDDSIRRQFIDRLRDVCHHVGFFYIKNHGIPESQTAQILTLTKAFFDLPESEKNKVAISRSPHFRGYGRLGAEITEGIPDYKETYDLGLEQPARISRGDQPYYTLQGPNQWPSDATLIQSEWKKHILDYISAMRELGKTLMCAMSLTLGLSERYFVDTFCSKQEDAYAMLRLLRYPPTNTFLGVGPHVDAGCLVLLLQDDVGGLQVQNCRGEWIDAPPIAGTFVANIGSMLQTWSSGYFLATPHRVINSSRHIRHSAPFFFEPDLSSVVTPLAIARELLADVSAMPDKTPAKIIYGEHMLSIYKRSFPDNPPNTKTEDA